MKVKLILVITIIHVITYLLLLQSLCLFYYYLLSAWRLAFQVYNGTLYTWDAATIGHGTIWALYMSDDSYTPTDPSPYEPYKSSILQDWEEKKISVQAVIKRTHNVETTFFQCQCYVTACADWLMTSGGHVPVSVVFLLDIQFRNLLRHRLLTFVKKSKKEVLTKGSAQIAAENAKKSKRFYPDRPTLIHY